MTREAADPLARLLGPDVLEALDAHMLGLIERVLADREDGARWMTPEQAGARYGVSASSLRKRCARGTVRYSHLPGVDGEPGRRLLIDVTDLDKRIAEDSPDG